MIDKYYTPTIEEFHVGFEFEEFVQNYKVLSEPKQVGNEWSYEVQHLDDRWVKRVYELDYFLNPGELDNESIVWDNIDPTLVRVKYLDKEDIEELGFEESLDEPDEWFWKFKGNIGIQLYFDDKYRNKDQGIGITIYDDEVIFSGYIKNKSELKVLLKQLGINE